MSRALKMSSSARRMFVFGGFWLWARTTANAEQSL